MQSEVENLCTTDRNFRLDPMHPLSLPPNTSHQHRPEMELSCIAYEVCLCYSCSQKYFHGLTGHAHGTHGRDAMCLVSFQGFRKLPLQRVH